MVSRTIASAKPMLFNERWTPDQLIKVSEIKRVYKLKDADILGINKVITKRNPLTIKYIKSEIEGIVKQKADEKKREDELNKKYPCFRNNKQIYDKMVNQMDKMAQQIDKTKRIRAFIENLKEREMRANGKFTNFKGARSDQPFPPNVLDIIAKSLVNNNYCEGIHSLRNLSETCKEWHSVVFDCRNEKKSVVSENIVVTQKNSIFNKLMKDPMLLSIKDMTLFMGVRSDVRDPMMLLYELLVRFNITGPIRIPFKIWNHLRVQKMSQGQKHVKLLLK